MAAINTARELARVRGQIDDAQQASSQLESFLQQSILGSVAITTGGAVGVVSSILDSGSVGDITAAAFEETYLGSNSEFSGSINDEVDQTVLRQMLYQVRALLGELRIEEQQWNTEVTEEKARRKELTEFAKA